MENELKIYNTIEEFYSAIEELPTYLKKQIKMIIEKMSTEKETFRLASDKQKFILATRKIEKNEILPDSTYQQTTDVFNFDRRARKLDDGDCYHRSVRCDSIDKAQVLLEKMNKEFIESVPVKIKGLEGDTKSLKEEAKIEKMFTVNL